MQREIRLTADGSHTVALAGTNITYHSHRGAIAESMHVFIEAGLQFVTAEKTTPIAILEVGFGTGLNALLSWQFADRKQHPIRYISIETSPLTDTEYHDLNYGTMLNGQDQFLALHQAAWEEDIVLDTFFTLHKKKIALQELQLSEKIDCIFFDAFAPNDQPEMWTEDVFRNLLNHLSENGVLVTYCSKTSARKAMQAAGFRVTKIPGPLGKRDMVRAGLARLP